MREEQARAAPGLALLVVEGVLDGRAEATLDPHLDALRARGRRHVAVDVALVRHATASGLAVLARHAASFRRAGGGIILVGCSRRLRACLTLLGLGPLFLAVCSPIAGPRA